MIGREPQYAETADYHSRGFVGQQTPIQREQPPKKKNWTPWLVLGGIVAIGGVMMWQRHESRERELERQLEREERLRSRVE
jgi:hypothetical protein